MTYEIITTPLGSEVIARTDDDGVVWFIPADESNSDYQRYLIDTDGGLPIPDSEPKV